MKNFVSKISTTSQNRRQTFVHHHSPGDVLSSTRQGLRLIYNQDRWGSNAATPMRQQCDTNATAMRHQCDSNATQCDSKATLFELFLLRRLESSERGNTTEKRTEKGTQGLTKFFITKYKNITTSYVSRN